MVLSATISPLRAMRDEVRQACAEVIINYLRAHGYLAAIPGLPFIFTEFGPVSFGSA